MSRAAVVVLMAALAASASAYDSQCSRADGSACQEGPDAGHNRWLGPSAEHEIIWEDTRLLAGLPASVSAPVDLDVFTGSDTVATAAGALPTLTPAPFASATRVRRRELTIGELAQLPDFSYALWDWALGNETCPLNDGSDAITCHDFERHMGPTNSNHFLPQARTFYAYYHALALGRAAKCTELAIGVGAHAARFRPLLEACEDEALMLEAVGHHYLQDAWSMGHMWERWGSPDLDAFPDVNTAVAVAMTSGLIHGARAALQSKLVGLGLFQDVPDALCAPAPGVEWRGPGMLAPALGLGDLYYPRLTDPSQPFGEQATRLFSCAAAGMRAVYAAAGEQHGPMGPLDPSLRAVDPLSDDCFAQRATNLAMLTGAALDVIENDGTPYRIALDGDFATTLVIAGTEHGVPDDAFLARYRLDMANALFRIQVGAAADPDGVQAASGALPPLLGVLPNGAYVTNPPSPYGDPPLPWTSDDMRETALVRTFHRAHADDLCRAMGQTDVEPLDLAALRDRAHATLPPDEHATAVAVCAELAARHLRFGKDESDYDRAHEPLCAFVQDTTAFAYTGQLGDFGPDDFAATRDAAESWCVATTTTTTTSSSTTTTTVPHGVRIEYRLASVGWSCLGLGQVPNSDPPPQADVGSGGGGLGLFPFADSGSTSWVDHSTPPYTATVQMDCSGSMSAALTFDAEGNLVGADGSGSTVGHASLAGDTWHGYPASARMDGSGGFSVWFRVNGGPVAYTIDATASKDGSTLSSAGLSCGADIIAQTDPAGGHLAMSGVLRPRPEECVFGAGGRGVAAFYTNNPTAVDFHGQWSATLTLTPLPPE